MQKPDFYDKSGLHISSICLRLDEIQYLQIERSEKGKHTNESMMLKMFYLYGFIR